MFPLDPDLTLAKMTIWSHQKEKAKTQIVDAERKQQQKSKCTWYIKTEVIQTMERSQARKVSAENTHSMPNNAHGMLREKSPQHSVYRSVQIQL